jgi:hypothetical protein
MSRLFALLLAVVLTVSLIPIGAAADTDNESAMNSTVEESGDDYLEEIDPTLRLTDWDYQDGEFVLRFDSDRSNSVTISEAAQFDEGAGQMAIRQENLPRGEFTVTISVPERAGEAGVVITTSASINAGHGTYVSTGQSDDSRDPFARTSSTAGWLGGAGTVTFMTLFAARRWLHAEGDEPETGWNL